MSLLSRWTRWSRLGAAVTFAVSALTAAPLAFSADALAADRNSFQITTLSTEPELVSGGDVLVRIDVPRNVNLQRVNVELNGRDVSDNFRRDPDGRWLTGLVTGLRLGKNTLQASTANGGRAEQLTITNHPIVGPIFSGPHQLPYICETQAHGLGAPLDQYCSASTKVEYLYWASDNTFKPLDPAAPRPSDLVQTTTSSGNTVPFIVRRETGTINRAVYQIAFLHEPGQPLPTPASSTRGWNGRLFYNFGGGCGAGYHQGRSVGSGIPLDSFLRDYAIARGYAMASSSLNVFGTNCNDVISAETMMMVKEHFIETFGLPAYTIGNGASGGSMQQHLIGHNYPGLLDGILPSYSFADSWTFLTALSDCNLIDRALNASAVSWTPEQRAAAIGHRTYEFCRVNQVWARDLRPTTCDVSIPPALIYNPVTNPTGTRCTLHDTQENIFGFDETTGFARRPIDNVGVQYGLTAFNIGVITADQFLDLNEQVGGFDVDGNIVASRSVADPTALRIAYSTGRINSGDAGLGDIPIIDIRSYVDALGDVHDASRSEITRARLIAANGHAQNQVLLMTATRGTLLMDINGVNTPFQVAMRDALDAMDEWLANIASDPSTSGSTAQKVVRNRPDDLVDACYTETSQKITDLSQCRQLFPLSQNPRLAAGEPLTQDILKCRLQPVSRLDYAQPLSSAQFARLRATFPEGVCDYSRPGVGQRPLKDTWLSYPRPGQSVSLPTD